MMPLITTTLVYAGFAAWSLAAVAAVGYWALRSITDPPRVAAPARIRERRTGSAAPRRAERPAAACCA